MYVVELDYENGMFRRLYEGEDLDAALRALNSELMLDRNLDDDWNNPQPYIELAWLYKVTDSNPREMILEIRL